ncbi:MAG: MBL fold metallo-hydrolase [Lachnospiraceae bacterium]|nr:MBL fold metallo-hydrolase [Lachnospiraceae bacterium]
MNKLKKLVVSALAMLSTIGVLYTSLTGQRDIPASSLPDGRLEVHFIDVGQGDATLILCGEDAMLIDAGENDKGTLVQSYLQAQGVTSLRYMIGTHPDSDHIGGMDVILYKFDCDTVMMPDKKKNTSTYRDVIDTMKNRGYSNTLPVVGDTYELGDASFTILAPSRSYEDSNNCSIAILLTYGNTHFLFTGDAEEEAEKDMLDCGISLRADVYKAGHHGSSTSSSEAFLRAVQPTYAVISCGEGNSYGHPHAEPLNSFRAIGIQVFRTDEQGSIIATSDGENITWSCSPTESWISGAYVAGSSSCNPFASLGTQNYIWNINTMEQSQKSYENQSYKN